MKITALLPWVFFGSLALVMLALDLGVLQRRAHAVRIGEALLRSALWILVSLLFGVWIYFGRDAEAGLSYFAGYLIELSLSADNMFVFWMIFTYFRVPARYQHKVLFWGILSALVMRAIFITAGIAAVEAFHWVIYVLGAFLIVTGVRMARRKGEQIEPEKNPVLKALRGVFPVSATYDGGKFFTKREGVLATPLLVVLVAIESTDLAFALDSIPAILAITRDPFIVYSSNIFAILGLRSLYFALAGLIHLFRYLHYGLSVILVFVGVKMLLSEVVRIPVKVALGVVAAVLLVSILASVWRPAEVVARPGGADSPASGADSERGEGRQTRRS